MPPAPWKSIYTRDETKAWQVHMALSRLSYVKQWVLESTLMTLVL